jgi:orotate phosphoribosyltransferase
LLIKDWRRSKIAADHTKLSGKIKIIYMNKKDVAKLLINLGCVQISLQKPFTYASGLTGPIYCDNRKLISHPDARRKIIQAFLETIKGSEVNFGKVVGLATAGIPHASWIAYVLDLPLLYVRGKAKEHGKKNQIEGDFSSEDRVILIEDLVNQGSSLRNAIEALTAAKIKTVSSFCIVDYQMASVKSILKEYQLSLFSLTDFQTILEMAKDLNGLSEEEMAILKKWHNDPATWKKEV